MCKVLKRLMFVQWRVVSEQQPWKKTVVRSVKAGQMKVGWRDARGGSAKSKYNKTRDKRKKHVARTRSLFQNFFQFFSILYVAMAKRNCMNSARVLCLSSLTELLRSVQRITEAQSGVVVAQIELCIVACTKRGIECSWISVIREYGKWIVSIISVYVKSICFTDQRQERGRTREVHKCGEGWCSSQ